MEGNSNDIQSFIVNEVERHSGDIVALTATHFNISRQRAHTYVSRAVKQGILIQVGERRWTRYFKAGGRYIEFKCEIKPGLAEDQVWGKYIRPMIAPYPENIQRICAYGFTEIFNNAIDHSDGKVIFTELEVKDSTISISIMDNGIGIFKKIKNALHLTSMREAILHLSKGKFTTDPSKHTGEGIFFASRIFDRFSILSDDMFYTFTGNDWFLSGEKKEDMGKGTYINMEVSLSSTITPKQIMDQYSDQEIGFGKTIVAVALSADPNDPHVSRSQAKRLLMGLEKFRTIVLDFKGVSTVGQAFVDEVFRVFKNEHPAITIQYVNADEEVEAMIKRGTSSRP